MSYVPTGDPRRHPPAPTTGHLPAQPLALDMPTNWFDPNATDELFPVQQPPALAAVQQAQPDTLQPALPPQQSQPASQSFAAQPAPFQAAPSLDQSQGRDGSSQRFATRAMGLMNAVGSDLGALANRMAAARNVSGTMSGQDTAVVEAAMRQLMSTINESVQQLHALNINPPQGPAAPAAAQDKTMAPDHPPMPADNNWDQRTQQSFYPSIAPPLPHMPTSTTSESQTSSSPSFLPDSPPESIINPSSAHSRSGSVGTVPAASAGTMLASMSLVDKSPGQHDGSAGVPSGSELNSLQVPIPASQHQFQQFQQQPQYQPHLSPHQQPTQPSFATMAHLGQVPYDPPQFSQVHQPNQASYQGSNGMHLPQHLTASTDMASHPLRSQSASVLPPFHHPAAAPNRQDFPDASTFPAAQEAQHHGGNTPSLPPQLAWMNGSAAQPSVRRSVTDTEVHPSPMGAAPTPSINACASVLQPGPSVYQPPAFAQPLAPQPTAHPPTSQTFGLSSIPAYPTRKSRKSASVPQMDADLVTEIPLSDKRYRNRKLLRDLREYLYRFLNTTEFRQISETYSVVEWVSHPNPDPRALQSLPGGNGQLASLGIIPDSRLFHPDFQSKDYYRTNGALMNELIRVGHGLTRAQPFEYGVAAGVVQPAHVEDVAKDLMDSARSGFRQGVRTQPAQPVDESPEQKALRLKVAERAKTKQNDRERGAARLRKPIPRQLLLSGAYSDDVASEEELNGISIEQWRAERARKLHLYDEDSQSPSSSSAGSKSSRKKKANKGFEALTPIWRNPALTRAYIAADRQAMRGPGTRRRKSAAGIGDDTDPSLPGPKRWRRDCLVNVDIPHTLRGRRVPAALFDPHWLAQHREELYKAPYYISVDDDPIPGWSDDAYAAVSEAEVSSPDSTTNPSLRSLSQARRTSVTGSPTSIEGSFPVRSSPGKPKNRRVRASVSSSFNRVRPRIVIDEKDTEWAVQDDDDDEGDEASDWVPQLERRRSEKRRRTSFPRSVNRGSQAVPTVPPPPPLDKSHQHNAFAVMQTAPAVQAPQPAPAPASAPNSASTNAHLPSRSMSFPSSIPENAIVSSPLKNVLKPDDNPGTPSGGLGNFADLAREFHLPLGDLLNMDTSTLGLGTPMDIVPQTPSTVARLMASSGLTSSDLWTHRFGTSDPTTTAVISSSTTDGNTTSSTSNEDFTSSGAPIELTTPAPPATDAKPEMTYHQKLQAHHQQIVQRLSISSASSHPVPAAPEAS